jgi:DNA-binding transcriptional ArsR family regulator
MLWDGILNWEVHMSLEQSDPCVMTSASQAACLLKVLAHKTRILILCRILYEEVSAGDLAVYTRLRPSVLSAHLARLAELSLVATRRAGQLILYRVASPVIEPMLRALSTIYALRQTSLQP